MHDVEADEPDECEGLADGGLGGLSAAQQQIGDQGHKDLDANGVFRPADEVVDLEVLLDRFKKQLNLPAILIDICDGAGAQLEMVRQKDVMAACFRTAKANPSQSWCPAFNRMRTIELDDLITGDAVLLVTFPAFQHLVDRVGAQACHEENPLICQ